MVSLRLDGKGEPFTRTLTEKGDQELATARITYLKIFGPGIVLISCVILGVFAIFWGALWKLPAHQLPGWIVDFDGGEIGQAVTQGLVASTAGGTIEWRVVSPGEFEDGVDGVIRGVKEEHIWIAVVVNDDASARLESAISVPDPTYNGEEAVTIYANEARNENAFRNLIRPVVQGVMESIKLGYATNRVAQTASLSNIAAIMAISPQIIVNPVSYTLVNLIPFSQAVGTATVSVGLIFVLIMSFFVVMMANNAREASGMNRLLRLRSLIALRFMSSFTAYFFLSLMYSFLNLAFKLDLGHKYGRGGFFMFWALNFIYMLAVGLALGSMVTIMKQFVPFFLITWLVLNISINLFPLEVLPKIFHYGFAAPFYNTSKGIRTVLFGTRNRLGLNFGVLIIWIVISCITMPLFQWFVRHQAVKQLHREKRRVPIDGLAEEVI
ncbi:hypothetical protein CPC08DRAFT_646653 [Agrocybe pediades]|nr:hypothetical protein CPC08DRAFT_646653 [Agrocybe pediades]